MDMFLWTFIRERPHKSIAEWLIYKKIFGSGSTPSDSSLVGTGTVGAMIVGVDNVE